jgi:tRNA/rRNA methyltransferase
LAETTERDRLSIVLVSTRNPLNIGAAARAMSNFGVSQLRLVNPYEPSFREAQSAVGAAELLAHAQEYKGVAEAIADCALVVGTTAASNRQLHHPLKLLPEGARLIRRRLQSCRVALLFGSEKRGLSNRDLSYCHWLLHIPAHEAHVSMNLGQAVAVCLYELARNKKKIAGEEKKPPASAGQLERITTILLDSLQAAGYINLSSEAAAERLRQLVRRMKLSASDAEIWLGMLRQVAWKLKS